MSDKTVGMFELSAPAILAFPNLLTPRAFVSKGKANGQEKFDATFLFRPDHPDLAPMKQALLAAAATKWANIPQAFEWPLRSGDALADKAKGKTDGKDREFFRGYLVLASRSQYAPGLSAAVNGRMKDFPMTGEERALAGAYFYGGCEVFAQFNFVPYEVGNNTPGVTAYLQVVASMNRGERNSKLDAGATRSGSAVFGKHLGQMSAVDPTAGMAGLP